jgi:hypothetical protein
LGERPGEGVNPKTDCRIAPHPEEHEGFPTFPPFPHPFKFPVEPGGRVMARVFAVCASDPPIRAASVRPMMRGSAVSAASFGRRKNVGG